MDAVVIMAATGMATGMTGTEAATGAITTGMMTAGMAGTAMTTAGVVTKTMTAGMIMAVAIVTTMITVVAAEGEDGKIILIL